MHSPPVSEEDATADQELADPHKDDNSVHSLKKRQGASVDVKQVPSNWTRNLKLKLNNEFKITIKQTHHTTKSKP